MLLLLLSVASAAAIEFGLASTASAVLTGEAGSFTVQQETYYSAPITLEAGHMVFTDYAKTRLKMPSGEYAITYFIGDIVFADTHQPVPLSDVYDHHWIAVSSAHRNQLCKGSNIEYVFGIGAESRHSPVSFSPGFGYHVANGTYWAPTSICSAPKGWLATTRTGRRRSATSATTALERLRAAPPLTTAPSGAAAS